MKDIRAEMPVRPDMVWDLLIRLSGIVLFVLLIIAYSTGEEFPHTHVMIGYSIAALVAVGVFWAVIRPHHAQFPPNIYSPRGVKALFSKCRPGSQDARIDVLDPCSAALSALILMLLTHTLWGTTWIDEMHEVAAYFALGLVAFYVAMVR